MNHLGQPSMPHLSWVDGRFDPDTLTTVIAAFASVGDLGVLELQANTVAARLCFDHGQLVAASCGPFNAEDALVEVLSMRSGRYRFCGGPFELPPPRSRIDRPVQAALMEAIIERERLDADDRASSGAVPGVEFDLSGLDTLEASEAGSPDQNADTIFWKLMRRTPGQRTVRETAEDFGLDLSELSERLKPFLACGLLRFGHRDGGVAGAFLNALERRMFELFGAVGLVMVNSAAQSAGIDLEAMQPSQSALLLTVLELEIPLERRRAFSWLARGLLERFNQTPLVPGT